MDGIKNMVWCYRPSLACRVVGSDNIFISRVGGGDYYIDRKILILIGNIQAPQTYASIITADGRFPL